MPEESDLSDLESELQAQEEDLVRRKVRVLLSAAKNDRLTDEQKEVLVKRARRHVAGYDAARKSRSSIDYAMPSPSTQRIWIDMQLPLAEVRFGRRSYSNVTFEQFYETLRDMNQETLKMNPATVVSSDKEDATQVALKAIDAGRDDAWQTHYAILVAGTLFWIWLDAVFERYGVMQLLRAKGRVEAILLRYNAHNSRTCLILEERALYGIRELLGVMRTVQNYVIGTDFRHFQEAYVEKSNAPALPVPSELKLSPPQVALALSYPQEAVRQEQVFLVAEWSSKVKVPDSPTLQAETKCEEEETEGEKHKGSAPLKGAVFAVRAADIAVDVSVDRNPIDVVSEFRGLLDSLIKDGIANIQHIKELASPVEFNITLNSFGDAVPTEDNASMLEAARGKLLQYARESLGPGSGAGVPRILFRTYFTQHHFPYTVGPGKVIGTHEIPANGERTLAVKTSEKTTEARKKAQSVTDTNSVTTRQDIKNRLEAEQARKQNATSEQKTTKEQTLDEKERFNTNLSANAGYNGYGIDVGIKYTDDRTKDLAIGSKQGASETLTAAREQALKALQIAETTAGQEAVAEQEAAVTESSEAMSERAREESEILKQKNPNRDASLNRIFTSVLQKVLCVSCADDVVVRFENDVAPADERPISALGSILDEYLAEDAKEAKIDTKERAKAACVIVDYNGRALTTWEPTSSGGIHFRTMPYFTILADHNLGDGPEDAVLQEFSELLEGVVVKKFWAVRPSPGYLVQDVVGDPALSKNEQGDRDEQTTRQREETLRLKKLNEIIDFNMRLVEGIKDEPLRVDAAFKLLKEMQEVLQKAFLIQATRGTTRDAKQENSTDNWAQEMGLNNLRQ